MIKQHLCKQCGRSFMGGPRAFYCHACRAERQAQSSRDCKIRIKQGITRKLGGMDVCERCGKDYIINAAIQRFCPDCKHPHNLEHDRVGGLKYYGENKNTINPVRNVLRHVGNKICRWCNKEFSPKGTSSIYCSDNCRRSGINKAWLDRYYSKK